MQGKHDSLEFIVPFSSLGNHPGQVHHPQRCQLARGQGLCSLAVICDQVLRLQVPGAHAPGRLDNALRQRPLECGRQRALSCGIVANQVSAHSVGRNHRVEFPYD